MAESMSGRILAIACAMTKADESERETLTLLCAAQEEALEKQLRRRFQGDVRERVHLRGGVFGGGGAGKRESGRGGAILPARGRPDGDEARIRRERQAA